MRTLKFSWALALVAILISAVAVLLVTSFRPLKADAGSRQQSQAIPPTCTPTQTIEITAAGKLKYHTKLVKENDIVQWKAPAGVNFSVQFDSGTPTPFAHDQNGFTQINFCSNPVVHASDPNDADVYHYQLCRSASDCDDPHIIVVGGNVIDDFIKVEKKRHRHKD